MNILSVTMSLFDLKQAVYLIDEEHQDVACLGYYPTSELSNYLLKECNDRQINKIRLFGNDNVLTKFMSELRQNNTYGINIDVEVN